MAILNKLVKLVGTRIDSASEEIESALVLSLSAFNMVPCVTYFTFEDEENIEQLEDLLVTYACYVLFTKKASGFLGVANVSDNGIVFDPSVNLHSAITLARELWNNWDSQVRNLKESETFYEDFVRDV